MAFDRGDAFIRVRDVEGAAHVERQFAELPKWARDELRAGLNKITAKLAIRVRAAGRASSRQAARASSTVRASRGTRPQVAAGPHPLLFLSEFGMNRRTGWYAAKRYGHSKDRQARPHLGGGSYWFFRSQEESSGEVGRDANDIADAVVRRWQA